MNIWIIRALVVVIGPILGYLQISNDLKGIVIGLAITCIIVILEILIGSIPLDTLVAAGIGIVLGFIFGSLIEYGVFSLGNDKLSEIMGRYSLLFKLLLVIFGLLLAVRKKEEVDLLDKDILKAGGKKKLEQFKILDTSVIIDGRIFDICQTGFVEGPLIIPTFVLEELRHIADSSDGLKRNRGRRGLDILNKIQKELNIEVEIWEKDFPNIAEVDSKLLKLAQVLNGKVITNDYNLNKVAEFQGVPVLNINELANAVKPVVLPGEEMKIQVMKDGKESGQGIAYLDDGTMIVVEGGRRYIGEDIVVIVTSVLQTAAGRMIFAKNKDSFAKT